MIGLQKKREKVQIQINYLDVATEAAGGGGGALKCSSISISISSLKSANKPNGAAENTFVCIAYFASLVDTTLLLVLQQKAHFSLQLSKCKL